MPTIVPTDAQQGVTPGRIEAAEVVVTSDGALHYSIPIWVPPGRQGIQPSLSLTYHSRSSNGQIGVGWSLAGLSRITVGGRTVNEDGSVSHVQFDGRDPFYLDGERLVCVAGTHGENGAEYRTQRDTFCKIILRGVDVDATGAPIGARWFEAFCKDGRILTFGNIGRPNQRAMLDAQALKYVAAPWHPGGFSTPAAADRAALAAT